MAYKAWQQPEKPGDFRVNYNPQPQRLIFLGTFENGSVSVEQDLKFGLHEGTLEIQVAEDGRVWVCLDGQALLRFKPKEPK